MLEILRPSQEGPDGKPGSLAFKAPVWLECMNVILISYYELL